MFEKTRQRAFVAAVWIIALGGQQVLAETPTVPAGAYVLDKTHASVVFSVSHLGFSFYTGSFARFDASLEFDPNDAALAALNATIDVTSLQIPAPPEGFLATLLGPEWFDAGTYPTMTFRSTGVSSTGHNTAKVTGMLTLKGVSAPVDFDVTFNGGYPGMAGFDPQARVGFSARGVLNRSDFNLAKGVPPKGTTMGVGDAVEFVIETEFTGPPLDRATP